MIPSFEGAEHVLSRRIESVQKPDVHDAEVRQRLACLNFANDAERGGLRQAGRVAALIAPRAEHHGDMLILIEDGAGEVGADFGLIVGMGYDNEQVGLEALIGLGVRGVVGARADCEASENEDGEKEVFHCLVNQTTIRRRLRHAKEALLTQRSTTNWGCLRPTKLVTRKIFHLVIPVTRNRA